VDWLEQSAADPNVWLAVGGGGLRIGFEVANATFGAIFVVVLTLYFVASLEDMKSNLYLQVPASRRKGFIEITETIAASVGRYLIGMAILALFNAVFTYITLSLAGVSYAAVLAAVAFGAVMPTAKDAGTIFGPLLALNFVPFYAMTLIISDPHAPIVQIFTYFPHSAPVTALLRNGFGSLSPVEATIVIAELFIIGFLILRLAVHLFRYGSIQYSGKLSIAGTFRKRSPLTGK
jgi:ABC-type Na+ efflux pump permease subunit